MSTKKNQKECKICKKLFIGRNELRNHITVHEGEKCQSCGKSFNGVQKLMKCESCGKLFSEAGYLKKHIRTVHEGHKDHKCESCDKSFSQAGFLKRHI